MTTSKAGTDSPKKGARQGTQRKSKSVAASAEQAADTHQIDQASATAQSHPGDDGRGVGKLKALESLVKRKNGATLAQMMAITGWQPHSIRGAISGHLRKKQGLNVVLGANAKGERIYRVAK